MKNKTKHPLLIRFTILLGVIRQAVLALLASTALPVSAAPFVYVTNSGSGDVSVIDTLTNEVVVPSILVGISPQGVAITPDGKWVYVANSGSDDVSVINTLTNKVVVQSIPVGISPQGVAITPDGKWVYVANYGSGYSGSADVSVIETLTNKVVRSIPLSDYSTIPAFPVAVAITPDGKQVYVADGHWRYGSVHVIDTLTNTEVNWYRVGYSPQGVAITPDGKLAYMSAENGLSLSGGKVLVIDTLTNTVVQSIVIGPAARGIYIGGVAITPNGKRVYVANTTSNYVQVIDTLTNTVVNTIPVGSSPKTVAITQDGKLAYVTNNDSNDVSVIDTLTNTVVVPSILVGGAPIGVAITPLRKYPTNKDQCKNGGWKAFGFKNKGQCIQYVNTRNKHDHEDNHDHGDK